MIPRRIACECLSGQRELTGVVDFVLPVPVKKRPFLERCEDILPAIPAADRLVKDEGRKAGLRNATAADQVTILVCERFPRRDAFE